MNRPQILGLLRHILTFAGGAMAAQGVASESDIAEGVGALVTLVGVIWSIVEKRRAARPLPSAAAAQLLLLCGLFMCIAIQPGCARFRTVQRDISIATNGVSRTIETTATASTFAASKQALTAWKAGQTDKSQTASVGSVNQESDASGLMQGIMALGRIAAAMQGIPLPVQTEPAALRSGPPEPSPAAISVPLQISVVPQVSPQPAPTPPATRPTSR